MIIESIEVENLRAIEKVPEFLNSLIVLDHDVYRKATRTQLDYVENSTENIIFLPDDVEEGMFKLLKAPIRYSEFEHAISDIRMPYDICFKDWTENEYSSNECNARKFVDKFINACNLIADKQGYDYMMGIPD